MGIASDQADCPKRKRLGIGRILVRPATFAGQQHAGFQHLYVSDVVSKDKCHADKTHAICNLKYTFHL